MIAAYIQLTTSHEQVINSWPIAYTSSTGIKYHGLLTVTTMRLLYKPYSNKQEAQFKNEILCAEWDNAVYMVIPKSRITNIITKNRFLHKQILLTLDNETTLAFHKKRIRVKPIIQAMQINSLL